MAHGDGRVFVLKPDMAAVEGVNVLSRPDSLSARHLARQCLRNGLLPIRRAL